MVGILHATGHRSRCVDAGLDAGLAVDIPVDEHLALEDDNHGEKADRALERGYVERISEERGWVEMATRARVPGRCEGGVHGAGQGEVGRLQTMERRELA